MNEENLGVSVTDVADTKQETSQQPTTEKANNSKAIHDDASKSPTNVKLPDNDTDALAAMQQQFGLINLDGKVWVFDRVSLKARTNQGVAAKLKLSPRQDGALLIKRALKAQYPGVSAKEIVDSFWVSTRTVCHGGVDFNPRGASEDYLNLWVGPTIVPKQGEWGLISILLLEIICNGDFDAYVYLKKYNIYVK